MRKVGWLTGIEGKGQAQGSQVAIWTRGEDGGQPSVSGDPLGRYVWAVRSVQCRASRRRLGAAREAGQGVGGPAPPEVLRPGLRRLPRAPRKPSGGMALHHRRPRGALGHVQGRSARGVGCASQKA